MCMSFQSQPSHQSKRSLTPSQIADLRLAASQLTGPKRRAFEAEMTLKYCQGNSLLAEAVFGWGRQTVALGLAEKRSGIICLGAQSAFSGRKRWEEQRTPRLALELAEACRAAGALEKALEPLEQVVAVDPTHLAANKLLVRAYSQLGDRKRATDRLDLYCMLNDDDPEVEDLRALIEAGPTSPEPSSDPVASPVAAPIAGGGNGSESFDLEPLWAHLDEDGYARALAAEGIFFTSMPAVAAGVDAEEATATLGELYLEQGHETEAERIFRAVLEREPGNAAAVSGLERLAAAGAATADVADGGSSLAARKASMLKGYLSKLRGGGTTDV